MSIRYNISTTLCFNSIKPILYIIIRIFAEICYIICRFLKEVFYSSKNLFKTVTTRIRIAYRIIAAISIQIQR